MADPITREQVERCAELARAGSDAALDGLYDPASTAPTRWYSDVPEYVRDAWSQSERSLRPFAEALTRWRDELAAAEPVRRVARWDGMAYALDPHHVIGEAHIVRETREQAISWGYEIEGGPEPIQHRREPTEVPMFRLAPEGGAS